jgi:uncharacterized protein YndB with AHSA1/START domain
MPAATKTVTIRRSPTDVFAFVADGLNAPKWRSGVLDFALESGSGVGATYRQGVKGPGGRRVAADYTVTAYEPPTHLAFRTIAGPVRPSGEHRLEAIPEGTRLTFSLAADLGLVKRIAMGRMVQRTMDGEVAAIDRIRVLLES